MSEAQRQEQPEQPRLRPVIPINADKFESWIKQVRSRLIFDEDLKEIFKEDVYHAVEMAIAAIQPWTTDAGLVVMASDPDAFKHDVNRKLIGVAETIKGIALSNISECTDALSYIGRRIHGETETKVSDEGPLEMEMSFSDERVRKSIKKCIEALKRGRQGILAFLISMDIILGAVQANLPTSLMSNVIKGRTGFFTD